MEKINFWHKLDLHRNKIIFAFCCLALFAGPARGQIKRTQTNLPNYDDRKLHYGFTLGINTTRYKLLHSERFVREDTAISALAPRSTGFSLGFILNYKIADYFTVRLLPTVSFYERRVNYILKGGTGASQVTESTFVEFPLMGQYRSERRGNLRMYMTAGLKAGIEAGAKKKEKKETDLRVNNYDLSFDYGFGLDIFYPFFKFSPEIRFSHGLLNLLNDDPNVYSQSLNRISTHTVSLFLHFE